jgi:type IV pilus assembly protein PilM
MDLKGAEQLKISSGRITEDEQAQDPADAIEYANNLIKSVVNNIMNDINRFFEFYNSRSIGNKLEKVYVCGGGSKLVGFEGYLGNYLGVPVEQIFASLNNVVYNGKKSKEEFCADFPLLINAIGSIVRS